MIIKGATFVDNNDKMYEKHLFKLQRIAPVH
jgi:hypothetical protein